MVVPLVVFPAEDSFRVIKEAVFTATSLVVLAIAATALIWRRATLRLSLLGRPVYAAPLAVVALGVVTTITSTHRALSVEALVHISSAAIFFAATAVLARTRRLDVVLGASTAAVVNVIVLISQLTDVWNPIHFPAWATESGARIQKTALLGNPNDLGAYFIAPALAGIAYAAVTAGHRRIAGLGIALASCAAIVLSETLTALAALSLGAAVMALLRWGRRAAAGLIIVSVAGGLLLAAYQPLRDRVMAKADEAAALNFDDMLSRRLTPFLAAIEMWKDSPVLGVGPGSFGYHYPEKKIAVEEKYAVSVRANPAMFEHTHNDHLQVLAETGTAGYVLMIGALVALGCISFRNDGHLDARRRFAVLLALPLTVAFAVAMAGGFPLQVAAPMTAFLFFGGLCAAWGDA